jgi:hypothetical protein
MKFHPEEPLPYPRVPHKTNWPGMPLSEEYLIPPGDKAKLLDELYPFLDPPGLDDTLHDIHEGKDFVVRDFKVVREGNMNMLVSPYYYRSGGSVIDWIDPDPDDEDIEDGDDEFDDELEDSSEEIFAFTEMRGVRPDCETRLVGLMERQHEGPAFDPQN